MNRIIALAHITFLNGARKHAIWGLFVFSLLLEMTGIFFVDFFGHDLGRVASDFLCSIIWLTGMIFILFYAVQAVSWDENNKTIDSILARPISRSEYVLGLWLGLTLLLLSFQLLLGGVAWGVLIWLKQAVESVYFPAFSSEHFILTWFGIQAMLLALLTVVMLISSAVRGHIPVLLISLAYWLICSGLPVVRESVVHKLEAGEPLHTLSAILQTMSVFFPDFSRLDFKDTILVAEGITSVSFTPWIPFTLVVLYTTVVITFACIIYTRRNIA